MNFEYYYLDKFRKKNGGNHASFAQQKFISRKLNKLWKWFSQDTYKQLHKQLQNYQYNLMLDFSSAFYLWYFMI